MNYRRRITELLDDGWRFAGLHATDGGASIRTLLIDRDGSTRLEGIAVVNGTAPSIVDLAPAAGWDEREAHDMFGVRFDGHEPLRPLIDHDLDLDRWTVPVRGHDPYQIAVGPIHAGVIESGHFRFHVVGDRILYLDARLFYKHRGLERAAEGKTLDEAAAYIARACAGCAVANRLAYAHACEDARGLRPTAELARVRTIMLELERVWNHLNDIAAVCAGVGLAAGNARFAALTERARRLNRTLTGHRFLFGSIQIAGSTLSISQQQLASAREELHMLHADSTSAWRELQFNGSFQDRLSDIGVVTNEHALRLGATGPAARAARIAADTRTTSDRFAYGTFEPVTPVHATGDVRARLEQRNLELAQSFALLDELLAHPIRPATTERTIGGKPIGIGLVESARGMTSCIVETSWDRVDRVRLRTGSYANWPAVAHAAIDNLLPDFPLINKSFELCYACADR
jgi:Ni,Fe-hydrogenase III large subunit